MRRLSEQERALLAEAAQEPRTFLAISQAEEPAAAELVRRGFAIRSWYRAAIRIAPAGRYLVQRWRFEVGRAEMQLLE